MEFETTEVSRRVLGRVALGAVGAAAVLGVSARGAQGQAAAGDIAQPPRADGEHFMRRALQMRDLAARLGDQAFGAVVVRAGQVVGQAPSRVVTSGDPTAHAETEAIRDACRRLGTPDLAGAELYSSSRPCPMCESAAYWARLTRMVHGAGLSDAGTPRYLSCP